ncbi:hypothetical protein [Streptomyces sp. NPDC020983]|uniref:hypothetical protein n=1 Tax=Streptomyces sp. NPDC020983 TaxID=3365106 RepID=UPI0037935C50
MNLKDARDQVEREHPELKGTARMLAIKALRDQSDAVAGAKEDPQAATKSSQGDVYCQNCDQPVRPVVRNGWGKLATFIALLQLAAVVVSVVACFTDVEPDGGALRSLAAWPAAVHPVGVGVITALVAFFVAVGIAGTLTRRAERNGTCPKCKSTLADQAAG